MNVCKSKVVIISKCIISKHIVFMYNNTSRIYIPWYFNLQNREFFKKNLVLTRQGGIYMILSRKVDYIANTLNSSSIYLIRMSTLYYYIAVKYGEWGNNDIVERVHLKF